MADSDDVAYRIETERRQVSLALVGKAAVDGVVFLGSNGTGGHENVSDLLAREDSFLPVLIADRVQMVRKRSIETLSLDAEQELHRVESYDTDLTLAVNVAVDLVTGHRIEGTLQVEQPEGASRTLDELNRVSSFLMLERENRVVFVGKDHISSVLEITE